MKSIRYNMKVVRITSLDRDCSIPENFAQFMSSNSTQLLGDLIIIEYHTKSNFSIQLSEHSFGGIMTESETTRFRGFLCGADHLLEGLLGCKSLFRGFCNCQGAHPQSAAGLELGQIEGACK